MIKRKRGAVIFFILGMIFLIASVPYSAAINKIMLDRNTEVKLAKDQNAILKLSGFQKDTYDLSSRYESFSTITNNTAKTLLLTVTVIPDFKIYHLLAKFGIEIGNASCEFRYHSSSPKQLVCTMAPGQTVNVSAYFTNNLFYALPVEFQFTAVDTAGTFTINLMNTANAPRCIYLY